MDTCFFNKSNLRWPPPAEQNTYGLIFVKQHYESLKATTPAEQNTYGHKFMFTAMTAKQNRYDQKKLQSSEGGVF